MKKLMDRIEETVKERTVDAKLSPLEDQIRKYILRVFARNGRPPTPLEIMEELRLSSIDIVNQTVEKLQRADILLQRGNEIISAYPFSAVETHYKVVFEDGHEVFALCATDALGIPFMLDADVTIISKCPQCKKEMRIVVKNGQIDSHNPDRIVEFVVNRERNGCTAETLCPFINFFCSKEDLKKWRKRNPEFKNGEIYSLQDALKHGRMIFGNLLK